MNRRNFLSLLTMAGAALSVPGLASAAQDVEFLRALERAQRDRPTRLGSHARIAPASEPGTPLIIHGRVFAADGSTPAPDVVVFAYHTDATGRYDRPEAGPHSWRLRGWAKTDGDGRFEFATIRPAPYPSGRAAAHVHLSLEAPTLPRQDAGLLFAGDPLISDQERNEATKAGRFGQILTVEETGGVQHVTLELRLTGRGR